MSLCIAASVAAPPAGLVSRLRRLLFDSRQPFAAPERAERPAPPQARIAAPSPRRSVSGGTNVLLL